MKMTVGTKIGAGYVLALAILAGLGIATYRGATDILTGIRLRVHTYQVLDNLKGMLSALEDAETGQRGYIIVGENSYLQPYRAALLAIPRYFDKLRKLTADDPSQQRRLDSLKPLISGKLAELKETIDLRRSRGLAAALPIIRSNRGKELMDEARKVIGAMEARETSLLQQRDRRAQDSARSTISLIVYGIPLAFLLLIAVGGLLTRAITRQLRASVDLLAASSNEILASTSQVAAGATETAAAVSETTATVEEVKQTAQLANRKANAVAETAQKASTVSLAGRQAMEDSIRGMHQIQEQMGSIAETIVRLSEQSQAIGEIIAAVNDLAEQSNLLAVNAAIEANKAGEQGKGFAVVAQEIRSLAEQSKQATAQVRGILSEIQKATSATVLATEQGHKAVEAGVRQSAEVGESIRTLAESVAEAAQAATQIAVSSQQQMVGMDQVALAMENIKQASAQNVTGTQQANVTAQKLHELGKRLGAMIGSQAS